MVSICRMCLLGDIWPYNIVLFFFQLLSFMYGHITFYHSGKDFIVLCSLCQWIFPELNNNCVTNINYFLLKNLLLWCYLYLFTKLLFPSGHEVFNDYMDFMKDLQLRLQNVSTNSWSKHVDVDSYPTYMYSDLVWELDILFFGSNVMARHNDQLSQYPVKLTWNCVFLLLMLLLHYSWYFFIYFFSDQREIWHNKNWSCKPDESGATGKHHFSATWISNAFIHNTATNYTLLYTRSMSIYRKTLPKVWMCRPKTQGF